MQPNRPQKSGNISNVSLDTLLQLYAYENKACTIEVRAAEDNGYIYIDKGNLVYCEFGNKKGKPALMEMLQLDEYFFEVKDGKRQVEPNINMPVEYALLDAIRLIDEENKPDEEGVMQNAASMSKNEELNDLLEKVVSTVDKVKGALAVAEDGIVLANKGVDTPEDLGAITTFVASAGVMIGDSLAIGNFRTAAVELKDMKLLAVNCKKYYLGILLEPTASITYTIDAIDKLLPT